MTIKRFSPKAAAAAAGIGGSTIRVWARDYGEFLSAGANPAAGEARTFTEADIAVLQVIRDIRQREALTTIQVVERLRQVAPADLQKPYIAPAGASVSSPIVAASEPSIWIVKVVVISIIAWRLRCAGKMARNGGFRGLCVWLGMVRCA